MSTHDILVRLRPAEQRYIGIWRQQVRELRKRHVKQDKMVFVTSVITDG
jgi:hypothetical protein